MKIVLVSFALCPFVHRSAAMLDEKGIEHEVKYIDLKNKPDWFLAISPRGKVPVLLADGTPIFESAVINEFLDETHPPRMLPDDAFERARQRGWIEVSNDLLAAQYKAATTTGEESEQARAQCASILVRFEEAVRGPFFAGDAFGLVDLAAAPALDRFLIIEKHSSLRFLDPASKVAAWARRVGARPSVRSGVPADFETLFVEALVARKGRFAQTLVAAP
jgi:glutathione S-transferase